MLGQPSTNELHPAPTRDAEYPCAYHACEGRQSLGMPGFRGLEVCLSHVYGQCAMHRAETATPPRVLPGTAPALPSGEHNLPIGQGLQGSIHVAGVSQVLHAREA